MNIRTANGNDLAWLVEHDHDASQEVIDRKIAQDEILVAEEGGHILGWLRHGLFWDNAPFMNMLFIVDGYRGKGIGSCLVDHWEKQMKSEGFRFVLTSTLATNERAQHFYRKRGYQDIGGFVLLGEPLEIILMKEVQ